MKMIKIGIPQYEDSLSSLEQAFLLILWPITRVYFYFTWYPGRDIEKVTILKYTQVFVLFVQNSMQKKEVAA